MKLFLHLNFTNNVEERMTEIANISRRLILIIITTLSFCINMNAKMLKDSVNINFRQSKIYLDTTYMNNPRTLRHVREMIDYYHRPDSNYVLTGVEVVGGASPEGSVSFNEWLSHRRAERIFDYIGEHFELPDSLTSFTFLGRDWEGLRKMVAEDADIPFKNETLNTLDDIIKKYREGETESHDNLNRIKRLHGGAPYKYMYRNLFPTLRASKLVLTFDNPKLPKIPVPDIEPPLLKSEIDHIMPEFPLFSPQPRNLRPFYMALKTNMLYDILAAPNIGAEFYLGKNFSIVGNWIYGWWKNDATAFYWRIYGGDVAIRWWFGQKAHEKPLTGHHVGLYGSLLTYDFELGGTGYMGGIPRGTLWDKCNHFFGLEYGYSLPIASRWNIDFNIGLGYWGGVYQVYDPKEGCYIYRETRKRNYWGPTKAEVSLVWLIGRGNINKKYINPIKKGGEL